MKTTLTPKIKEPPPPHQNFLPRRDIEQISCGLLHDLINPITGLTLYLETLDPRKFKNIVTPIVATSKTIRDYINIIRDAITHRPHKEFISIESIAKHTSQILAHKALRNNVKIIVAHSVHNDSIYMEKIKMYQIFINTLSNAIDAFEQLTSRTHNTVTVSISKKHKNFCLVIADNGCGISHDITKKIFSESYTSKKTGSGFGLMHTHSIIRELGGNINIETEIGVGTKFHISLPRNN